MKTVIQAENLTKSLGGRSVLKGLSFSIEQGQFIALLGPNGAGKTTLMSLLSGLRKPESGSLKVFGEPAHSDAIRELRGMTPQELDYPQHLKVSELLHMVQGLYSKPRELHELKELFRLAGLWDQKAGGLSGGQKRLVGLAIAFIGNPKFVILDEPTTGLDLEAKEFLWNFLTAEKKRGTTVLLTSHDLDEMELLAEKLILLHQGQILFDGPMSQILSRVQQQRIEFSGDWDGDMIADCQVQTFAGKKTLVTSDSDRIVRELVRSEISFTSLRVESAGLEEALKKMQEKEGE